MFHEPSDDVALALTMRCEDFENELVERPGLGLLPPLCALLDEVRTRTDPAAGLTARLDDLLRQRECPGVVARVDWPGEPYPGMAAFDHTQAPIFFGRGTETDELLAKLHGAQGARLILVAGRSGSGKSSLVRAGLWPRLSDAENAPAPAPGAGRARPRDRR